MLFAGKPIDWEVMENEKDNKEKSRDYKIIESRDLPESETEVSVLISWKDFEPWRKRAVLAVAKELSVSGFRKGMVPENVAVSKIGEEEAIREGVRLWAEKNVIDVAKEKAPEAISAPRIVVTKAVPSNDVEFRLIFEKWPSFDLPDFRALAKDLPKKEDFSTDEKEIDEAVMELRRMFAWQEADRKKEKMSKEEFEKSLPEANDEWAKKIGAESLTGLRQKLKKDITEDKARKERQKRASLLVQKIIDKAGFAIPRGMVEEELDRIEFEMRAELERMGLDFESYLKHIKKTAEDLRQENRKSAENRAKSRLVLIKIASKEDIKPDEKAVNEKTEQVMKENPGLDKERTRNYILHTAMLEATWKFLENL